MAFHAGSTERIGGLNGKRRYLTYTMTQQEKQSQKKQKARQRKRAAIQSFNGDIVLLLFIAIYIPAWNLDTIYKKSTIKSENKKNAQSVQKHRWERKILLFFIFKILLGFGYKINRPAFSQRVLECKFTNNKTK